MSNFTNSAEVLSGFAFVEAEPEGVYAFSAVVDDDVMPAVQNSTYQDPEEENQTYM